MNESQRRSLILAAAARVEAIGMRACALEEQGLHAQALAGYRQATEASRQLVRLCSAAARRGEERPPDVEPQALLNVSLANVARSLEILGDHEAALNMRRRLVREARQAAEIAGTAAAADGYAQAVMACAWTLGQSRRHDMAVRLLRRAARSAGRMSPSTQAQLTEALAMALDRQGRWAEGLRLWEAVGAEQREIGDPSAAERSSTQVMISRAILGYPARSHDHYQAPSVPTDQQAVEPSPGAAAIHAAFELGEEAKRRDHAGDTAGAEAGFVEAIERWSRLGRQAFAGARSRAAALRVSLGLMVAAAGRHAEAIGHLDRARAVFARARRQGLALGFDQEIMALCGSLALRQARPDALARAFRAVDLLSEEVITARLESSLGDQAAIDAFAAAGALGGQLDLLWDHRSQGRASARAARSAYRLWLALALRVLGECSPQSLLANETMVGRHVEQALRRRLKLRGPDLAVDVARWVLCTQGLRAQRDVVMVSRDAEVQALAALWREIDDLDRVALGQAAGPDASDRARRRELAWRLEAMRTTLVERKLLPPVLAPEPEQLAASLPEGEHLWILVPVADPPRLLVVTVQTLGGRAVQEAIGLQILSLPGDGAVGWMGQLDALCAAMAQHSRGPLRDRVPGRSESIHLARSSAAATFLKQLHDGANAIARAVAGLKDTTDCREIDVVPVGDAHALPWSNLLQDALLAGSAAKPRVRQHASLSSWLTYRSKPRAAGGQPRQPLPPAIAFDDASTAGSHFALPMVWLEATLSWRLWRDRAGLDPVLMPDMSASTRAPWPPKLAPERRVSSLIGMGHGRTPDGNWARAGLWMPGWPGHAAQPDGGAQLDASCLPPIATVRRVFMSCCILGRTEERFGESLGFLALACGMGVEVGIGSLLPVDDAQAVLISLAFQWKVQHAKASSEWIDAFHELRGELQRGQWPVGFPEWLQEKLGNRSAPAGTRRTRTAEERPDMSLLEMIQHPPTRSMAQAINWYLALGS